jgi:signal transduction histidine kinase
VADDGRGFTPPDLSVPPTGVEHSGLHRMWLRMRGRGGDLEVVSAPGAGATLRFRLPLGVALERSGSW